MSHEPPHHAGDRPSGPHPPAPMAMAHAQGTPWPHFANMTLGLWLITSAFALGYRSTALQVSDVAIPAL